MMRVAVVIAARDIAAFLGDAIGSALSQGVHLTAVIAVDDGSADDTPRVIVGQASPFLHTIRTSGLGVATARNLGARHPAAASADALLFLDGDDWLTAGAIARLVAILTANPRAAAAYGAFAYVPESARPDTAAPLDIRRAPSRLPLSRLILGNRFANGGHVLIRQGAWQATGGFHEGLRFAEDWEFWPRLRLAGPFTALPGPPVLMVRRRAGSLMHGSAADLAAYQPALAAIAGNSDLAQALGASRHRRLMDRVHRELDWTIGREVLRRGAARRALPLLARGFFGQVRPQRSLVLLRAAWRARRGDAGTNAEDDNLMPIGQ